MNKQEAPLLKLKRDDGNEVEEEDRKVWEGL